MRYYWGIKKIKEDRDMLSKMLEEENDIVRRQFLSASLAIADSLLFSMVEEEYFSNDLDFTNYYKEQLQNYDFCEYYFPYVKDFQEKTSKLSFKMKNLSQDTITLKREEVFTAVLKFYETIEEYKDLFTSFYENRGSYIRFSSSCSFPSVTFLPGVNHFYMSFPKRESSFEEVFAITHEYAHALSAVKNPNRYFGDLFFLTEIESHFFELISSDFYAHYFETSSFYQKDYFLFKGYEEQATTLIEGKKVIELLKKYPHLYEEELLQKARQKNLFLPQEMKKHYMDVKDSYRYLMSYLVSLELYNIYQSDPSLALHKLDNITCQKRTEDEVETIFDEVTLNQSIKTYYKNLTSKIGNYKPTK